MILVIESNVRLPPTPGKERPKPRGGRQGTAACPLCEGGGYVDDMASDFEAQSRVVSAGSVRHIEPAGTTARHESRVRDNHRHVVRRSCGAIADVDCASGRAPCLTASDDQGFVAGHAEVVSWGSCPGCATRRIAH